jgi:outer membrane murein-binding lipoprotein Lpp
MMNKNNLIFTSSLCLMLGLSGCGSDAKNDSNSSEVTQQTEQTPATSETKKIDQFLAMDMTEQAKEMIDQKLKDEPMNWIWHKYEGLLKEKTEGTFPSQSIARMLKASKTSGQDVYEKVKTETIDLYTKVIQKVQQGQSSRENLLGLSQLNKIMRESFDQEIINDVFAKVLLLSTAENGSFRPSGDMINQIKDMNIDPKVLSQRTLGVMNKMIKDGEGMIVAKYMLVKEGIAALSKDNLDEIASSSIDDLKERIKNEAPKAQEMMLNTFKQTKAVYEFLGTHVEDIKAKFPDLISKIEKSQDLESMKKLNVSMKSVAKDWATGTLVLSMRNRPMLYKDLCAKQIIIDIDDDSYCMIDGNKTSEDELLNLSGNFKSMIDRVYQSFNKGDGVVLVHQGSHHDAKPKRINQSNIAIAAITSTVFDQMESVLVFGDTHFETKPHFNIEQAIDLLK